ncbi:MAG TPA: hypothetical protein VFX65_02990, partial [Candidatus Limnocylindrales bacterium]|nr:hypothetical protein [Candidatus Limnocylindrales bacterium]
VMHERRIGGLYVVDVNGRPTGYLDLLELAVVYAGALAADAERAAGGGAGAEAPAGDASAGPSD